LADHVDGLRVHPILDTQIAWALQALTQAAYRAATVAADCGSAAADQSDLDPRLSNMDRIGLGNLLEHHGLMHDAKEQVKAIMRSREG